LVQNFKYTFGNLFDDTLNITWNCWKVNLTAKSGDSTSDIKQVGGTLRLCITVYFLLGRTVESIACRTERE